MALIVEDGTLVANANSYASLATIKAYAALRGITLGTDPVIENQAILATDYIESKRNKFQGLKVLSTQALQFPRIYLVIDDNEFPENEIPKELINAECQLVIEQQKGIELMPTINEAPIKKEVIGPMSTEYAVSEGNIFEPALLAVDALLQPLFKNVSSGFSIKTIRV